MGPCCFSHTHREKYPGTSNTAQDPAGSQGLLSDTLLIDQMLCSTWDMLGTL